jgi:hypothetical protein
MKLNAKTLVILLATAAGVILANTSMLPERARLPVTLVALVVVALCEKLLAQDSTAPPQTGRGQGGRASLGALLAMLALCLSLPLLTGCPKSGTAEDASQARQLSRRAERVAKVVEHAAGDIATVGDVTRELRAGGVVSDDGARDIEQAALEANTVLAEGVNQALGYGTLDEFARSDLYTHLDKFRSALAALNERGALHIKNDRKRALFSALLDASEAVLRRAQSDFDGPLPAGTSFPLGDEIRRRLGRARDQCAANDKKLREDLARPADRGAPAA